MILVVREFLAVLLCVSLIDPVFTEAKPILSDCHGAAGADTYDYDAFGNLIHSIGSTPNNYLFAGEQFDPDLNLYYNRARYLNVSTGRFWTMDTFEGDPNSPASLHKYLYASGDPIDRVDPSGHDDYSLGSLAITAVVAGVITGLATFSYQIYKGATLGQAAKAGAIGFVAGAGFTATVYAVVWARAIAYVAYATSGLTLSLQVYNSFQGGQVNVVELEEDLPVVRYYGGQAVQLGRYWTTQLYDSTVGAIEELALNPNFGNTADRVVTGVIPKGTQILAGYAAAQGGLPGGGVQIFVPRSERDSDTYRCSDALIRGNCGETQDNL